MTGKSHGAPGASLHMCMTPHGPDAATFERAVAIDSDAPEHLPRDTLAFMFEVPAAPCCCVMHSCVRVIWFGERLTKCAVFQAPASQS